MLKNPTNTNVNSIIRSTKYYALPMFNRLTRNQSNLATIGLFSALAACAGSELPVEQIGRIGSNTGGNAGGGNAGGGDAGGGNQITGINFNTFTAAAPILVNNTTVVSGVTTPIASTRYDSGDADTTTLYIREGINTGGDLGSLTTSVTGTGTLTYSITSSTFDFGNSADGNDVATYFAIDNNGALSLQAGNPLDFGDTSTTTLEDKSFTFEVTASAGNVSDTHTVTVHLGDSYTAPAAGSPTSITYTLSSGDDLFQGGVGGDTFDAGAGNNIMYGVAGGNRLIAGAGTDTIYGGVDRDWIWGGAGDDIIYGGAGVDEIHGNEGDDILYGGENEDRFVVFGRDSDNNGSDIVKDFNSDQDRGDKIVIFDGGLSLPGRGGNNVIGISYDNGNAIVTGYGAMGSQITLEAHDGITWDATTNPLEPYDFTFS